MFADRCEECHRVLPDDASARRKFCNAVCRALAHRRGVARVAVLGAALEARAKHDPHYSAMLAELA